LSKKYCDIDKNAPFYVFLVFLSGSVDTVKVEL